MARRFHTSPIIEFLSALLALRFFLALTSSQTRRLSGGFDFARKLPEVDDINLRRG